MKYFKQLNKILSTSQKKAFVFLTLLMFVSMLFEILTLNSLFLLLTLFTNPSSLENSKFLIFFKDADFGYNFYLQFLIIFFIIFFLKTIINILVIWKEKKYINLTRAEISYQFFRGYIYMPRIFHLRTNISETTKNLTDEINSLISALLAISIITLETFVLIGLIIFLLFINFKITLLSFFSLLIFSFLLSYLNTKKIILMGKDRVKLFQVRLKHIIEGLSGAKIFALTGSQEKLIADFKNTNLKIASIGANTNFRNEIPRPLFELFILLIAIFFLFFFLKDNSEFKTLIPTLGVFLTAAYRLAPSLGKILSSIQRFQYSIQSAKKLSIDKEKFLTQEENNPSTESLEFNNEIKINNISYSYNKNLKQEKNFVLKNIDFEIKQNSKIGIMGKSGSGKSTLLDLLMAIITPQDGEILVDGKDLTRHKKSWYKIIGCVPQDVFILDDTLKKNIAFGLPDNQIEINKLNKAIELANLTELKRNLRYGLDTLVGEKGSRLSGGQRQRIGIARALYNEPNVLFFDEPTSALDIETEKKIINEVFLQQKNKTIIFVSHNRENLKYCDTIYEMKDRKLLKIN